MLSRRAAAAGIAVWACVYAWNGLAAHLSLRTNAYDLSLFDYSLWGTLQGHPGRVAFTGHTVFAEHFMPILFVIVPVYALAPGAVTLILLQILVFAAAAGVLYLFTRRIGMGKWTSAAVLVAFLLSRRSNIAVLTFFHPESFQPLLTFAMLYAWYARKRAAYWIALVLLLATKEDAAMYVAVWAAIAVLMEPERWRMAVATAILAVVWLGLALGVAIPVARAADGLPGASPLIDDRYTQGGPLTAAILASRVTSYDSVTAGFNLIAGYGFTGLMAPLWLLVAVPGVLVDVFARPGSLQANVLAHYTWPFIPWMAIASALGLRRVERAWPRAAVVWAAALIVLTVVDGPLFRGTPVWRIDPKATEVLSALNPPAGKTIAVQPNLLPHIVHTNTIAVVNSVDLPPNADFVALTNVGDLRPFGPGDIARLAEHYRQEGLRETASGPLIVFER